MRKIKRYTLSLVSVALAALLAFSVAACNVSKQPVYYTVVYYSGGGEYARQVYGEGQNYADPGSPVISGYEFEGWYSQPEGGGFELPVGQPVTGDGEFYAYFTLEAGGPENPENPTQSWTVTYHTEGGSKIPPEKVEDGRTITALDPYLAGHDFAGWYLDQAHTQPFAAGTPVHGNLDLYAAWRVKDVGGNEPSQTCTVTFMSDGQIYAQQRVAQGQKTPAPKPPEKAGHMFTGWYLANSQTAYNFDAPVTGDITLTAKFSPMQAALLSSGAYNESLYVTFADGAPSSAKAEYKAVSESQWHTVDAPLVRAVDDGEARVDIVGLKKGSYNVKITSSDGSVLELPAPIEVTAYDRSGYAHFNYTDGVGAYTDDGGIKAGALVIYVTEENKNDVLDYAYADGKKVDIKEYMVASSAAEGVTAGQQRGIGEMLNNRRYAGADRMNCGIAKLCQVYGSVAIRIIGSVSAEKSGSMESTINGLTDYNSTGNGGSKGDNGRMARMVNAKNLTIEGIGEDACIYGWGVHFIASDVLNNYPGAGKGFEVRNLTFEHYPEDAVGMEGIQGDKWDANGSITSGASSVDADLPSPVERCWIHNNSFKPGYASSPAESDKAEGDGSCDFKRGMYYTLSYCHFVGCHKTNLIGSSDSSLQFNITMHHNRWENCGSRIPLVRNANVHFYNNYIYGDMTATPKPALSHVTSARANSYMFAENNYYDGCKSIVELASGGAVKFFGNMVYADFNGSRATVVKSRTESVANNCKFGKKNISYANFDTDPALFYYDAQNGASDCLLDDAVTARQRVLMYAGANGHGVDNINMNKYEPEGSLSVPEQGFTVTLGQNAAGITFNGLSKGKFKGQGITFTLSAEAELTVSTPTTGDPAPELVSSEGYVYAHKFTGTLTIVLPAGTYFIASGQKDKEATVTAMSFANTARSSQARLEAAAAAIENLPQTAELTEAYAQKLKEAQSAYGALTADEKRAFAQDEPELAEKLFKAEDDYSKLQIAHVRGLIAAIGQVTKNSYSALQAAQTAYDALDSAQKAQLAADKATLDQKWAEYENYAVQNVIDMIETLSAKTADLDEDASRALLEELIAEADRAAAAYGALSDGEDGATGQKAQVTNYAKLAAAEQKLGQLYSLYEFTDGLAEFEGRTVTIGDAAAINALKEIYDHTLTKTQKDKLTGAQAKLYDDIVAALADLQNRAISVSFEGGLASDSSFVLGEKHSPYNGETFTAPDGTQLSSGMKMESKTTVTFTTSAKMVITMYFSSRSAGNQVQFDGQNYNVEAGDGYFTVTLTIEAGTHTIAKKSTNVDLFYLTLIPA